MTPRRGIVREEIKNVSADTQTDLAQSLGLKCRRSAEYALILLALQW